MTASPVTGPARASAPAWSALPPLAAYTLGLADDALVLAQRLTEWAANAPQLEEDVALANIALDLLGQARVLLTYAGEIEGAGRDEDDLALGRDEHEFRNVHLVETPNGDFAVTMARQLAFSAYQYELYAALTGSADATLAGLAAKAVKEVDYHRDHATRWVLRLGDGTELSHARMQAGLDRVWSYVDELFETDPATAGLAAAGAAGAAGVAVDATTLRPAWERYVHAVVEQATLAVPEPSWRSRGGRSGVHSEHLGHLLAPMQHLHRTHPGVTW